MTVQIGFDSAWQDEFLKRIDDDGPWGNWELYKLAVEVENHTTIPDFEGLQAPKHLPNLTPLPHQLEVAKQVVESMNGKAILADEVGLGKTIEAGLILKEYMIRGLVKKVLILVPASLVSQWAMELNSKFFIPAVAQRKSYVWEQCDVVVSSIDTAKRNPHRDIIYSLDYDLIIIDEAHKLKNNKTKNYEFVQNLKKKFCLLLTATPIQNRISEIFNLVSLLKPGHLGNESAFYENYKKDSRSLNDDAHLKELVNKVMIRNRRADTGIEWTKRHVETIPIEFSQAERELYEAVTELRGEGDWVSSSQFSVMTLQREACSSREAVYFTLQNMLKRQEQPSIAFQEQIQYLIKKVEAVQQNSKAQKALELIQNINDKVIIFTEYRATQMYLQWFLKQYGITSVPFRGGFKRGKKDWMRELFQKNAQVLIATEAGGEGINLQFCNHIINFDLPWNPMRLEQRIGRIHRLGQEKDVMIYNFATKDTVEEHVMKLLYEKIHLFEKVIGDLDDILTKLEFGSIDDHLVDIFGRSASEGEMRIKMENLTSMIQFAEDMKEGGLNAATGNS
ncbi:MULTISPECIES: DEAD/DEAH box helicase [Cytobacillus]|jgi:SNF2 family DNA or RNA helicase|uniref:ATP-dependent helicase n=2 Tax=Cytobacillus TaxID=2675230 RepID=A0ABX3CU46_9BACI|nr:MULTISPECIES: SNF2-related protein [Cytobacillus]MCM3242217.1 DEAD/DEAH box helicase [Cytobacillus oceanisediminis]MCM3401378.1 DEAD/DEAH box helicase [Cytobacillus oceanisediminis]MDK7664409.1 SNF2-related protein [Cytobacillus oceanisediminis]OHX48748.1 ATP-dependent helicase [Cytobacillus oceanisediminis]QOK25050.1 DEAD/DEAH box helicase [Cytobacillus oceanisediminis]